MIARNAALKMQHLQGWFSGLYPRGLLDSCRNRWVRAFSNLTPTEKDSRSETSGQQFDSRQSIARYHERWTGGGGGGYARTHTQARGDQKMSRKVRDDSQERYAGDRKGTKRRLNQIKGRSKDRKEEERERRRRKRRGKDGGRLRETRQQAP